MAYWGRGDGGGGSNGGGGRGRLYIAITVATRMIPALRWAAMRTILMFQVGNDGQSKQDSVHKPQPF